jgi:hypothetical protein
MAHFDGDDARAVVLCFVVLCAYYVPARWLVVRSFAQQERAAAKAGMQPRHKPRDVVKAKAWLLTLLVSFLMSLVGCHYAYVTIVEGTLPGGQLDWGAWLLGDGTAGGSRLVASGFFAFLLADLVIGVADYYEEINPLTGWVHHSVYLALLAYLGAAKATTTFAVMAM